VVVVDLPTFLVDQDFFLVPAGNDVLLGESHQDGSTGSHIGIKLYDCSRHVEEGEGEGV
jgi:hypothetical protein